MKTPDPLETHLGSDPWGTVLAQHRTLRKYLRGAIQIAQAALADDQVAQALLTYTLLGLSVAFERHVALEETELLPLIEIDLPLGPERVALWRREHARLAAQLTGVVLGGEQQVAVLAVHLCLVAEDMLRTMDNEDRTMLVPTPVQQSWPRYLH